MTDNEIIETVRNGGDRHYSKIIDRYKDRAFCLAVRMLRSKEDAEEAVQDAFIRAFKALRDFRGDSKFSTWFYRITYNVCLSKMNTRGRAHELTDSFEENEFNFSAAGDLQAVSELKDLADIIRSVIDKMPDRYCVPLTLFYFEELTYQELSSVLELPVGTVKTNLFRGRSMLQRRLQEVLKSEEILI